MKYVLKKGSDVARTEVHSFGRNDDRVLIASCYATEGEEVNAHGVLHLFDGANETSARTVSRFETPSDQQTGSVAGIQEVDEPNIRVAGAVGNLKYAVSVSEHR